MKTTCKTRKNQKGITLIALVITIIIMLLLAGVTINMVINGGLIDYSKEARFKQILRDCQESVSIGFIGNNIDKIVNGSLQDSLYVSIASQEIERRSSRNNIKRH